MSDLPFHKRVPTRVRGLLLLGMGLVISYFAIWRPLTAVERGDSEVWLSHAGIGLGSILTVFGAAFVLIGPGFERLLESGKPDPKNLSFGSILFIAPFVLLSAGVYIWVRMRLTQMGFEF